MPVRGRRSGAGRCRQEQKQEQEKERHGKERKKGWNGRKNGNLDGSGPESGPPGDRRGDSGARFSSDPHSSGVPVASCIQESCLKSGPGLRWRFFPVCGDDFQNPAESGGRAWWLREKQGFRRPPPYEVSKVAPAGSCSWKSVRDAEPGMQMPFPSSEAGFPGFSGPSDSAVLSQSTTFEAFREPQHGKDPEIFLRRELGV